MWSKWPHLFGQNTHMHVQRDQKVSKSVSHVYHRMWYTCHEKWWNEKLIMTSSKSWKWVIQKLIKKWVKNEHPKNQQGGHKSQKGAKKGGPKMSTFWTKRSFPATKWISKMNTKLKMSTFWQVLSKSGYPLLRVDLSVRTHKTRKWKNRKKAIFEPLKWSLFVKNWMWVWSKK